MMGLVMFLILTHGVLIFTIINTSKKSSEKTKRINKIMEKVTKNMSQKEIDQWWVDFNGEK